MSKDSGLRAQHGEGAYKPHLNAWLQDRGFSEAQWAEAWNAWWSRMENDPSGQLHAQFAMLQQEAVHAAHLADIPDASADAKEGVTLDTYAMLMAKAAGGGDLLALTAEAGLSWEQWQRAQTAWNLAMSQDVDHHLTIQYGQLYAKHTPGFQQQMQGQIAAQMAAQHATRDLDDDEPEPEYTFADMVRELDHEDASTRYTAAHHVANRWDIGERGDAELDRAARRAVALARVCLEAFDEETVSEAEALANDLKMFAAEGFFTPSEAAEAKRALDAGLVRARAELARHEAAFAPVRDKAVPERVRLQMAVQDHTSLVEELESIVEDWDDTVPEPSEESQPAPAVQAGPSGGSQTAPVVATDPGLLGLLKSLPVVGDLLRMLGM
jgi:hypothetical protein